MAIPTGQLCLYKPSKCHWTHSHSHKHRHTVTATNTDTQTQTQTLTHIHTHISDRMHLIGIFKDLVCTTASTFSKCKTINRSLDSMPNETHHDSHYIFNTFII